MVGRFTKRVTVTTNDPKQQKTTLSCKGKVLVPFKASPRYANFRDIEDDTTPAPQSVKLQRGDGGPLKLEVVGAGKRGIEAELREIKPGESYELIVSVLPPQKTGKLRTWIKLKTGIDEVPTTTVPVYADIPQGWSAAELATAQ